MNVDERIQFLVQSQESLGKNIEELHEIVNLYFERLTAQQVRSETRERQAREALLAGIAAYLRALGNGGAQ